MKFFRLIKGHGLAFVLCLVLLVGQAWSDLALPGYMSEIVDVGIQQMGVESPLPTTVRQSSLAALEAALPAEAAQTLDDVYGPADDAGIRTVHDDVLEAPAPYEDLVVQALAAGMAGANLDASMARQAAVALVAQEYEAQGIDMDAVQGAYLWRTAGIMFAYCAVSLICAALVALVASRTAATVGRDTRRAVFAKVMGFSAAEVNSFSQASLITRCTNDVQQVQMVVVMLMRMVMLAPIMGVVALTRVLATRTGLEWTIGVALVVVCAGLGLLMGVTMSKFKRMQTLIDRVNLKGRDMLDGIMPMRAFGRQDYELDAFRAASSDLMGTQLFTTRAMAIAMPLLMFVMNGVTLLIVWFGAHGVDLGTMQVGDMMAFISYAMQIIMSFMILSMVLIMLPRAAVSADRITAVLDEPLTVVDPDRPRTIPADAPRGVVSFEDVSFAYPDADANAIEHVSFTTAPGRTTAIIGPTGSGKTSVVQLVPRLFDATVGRVTLDGVDVRDLALQDLRSRIGYVPQQGMLFSGTIESNVGFGLEGDEADAQDVAWAVRVAQAEEFVAEKDDGMQSAVAQRGANVSGGQRQRLAIARALAIRPEVVVFDDSFSALDYATDARLRAALRDELSQTAVIMVAQRIATIMHADEIIVLDEGRVVGRGTHEQLLRTCPTYLDIAKSQLSPHELGLDEEAADSAREGGGR